MEISRNPCLARRRTRRSGNTQQTRAFPAHLTDAGAKWRPKGGRRLKSPRVAKLLSGVTVRWQSAASLFASLTDRVAFEHATIPINDEEPWTAETMRTKLSTCVHLVGLPLGERSREKDDALLWSCSAWPNAWESVGWRSIDSGHVDRPRVICARDRFRRRIRKQSERVKKSGTTTIIINRR